MLRDRAAPRRARRSSLGERRARRKTAESSEMMIADRRGGPAARADRDHRAHVMGWPPNLPSRTTSRHHSPSANRLRKADRKRRFPDPSAPHARFSSRKATTSFPLKISSSILFGSASGGQPCTLLAGIFAANAFNSSVVGSAIAMTSFASRKPPSRLLAQESRAGVADIWPGKRSHAHR
jgi:hypothetical protein